MFLILSTASTPASTALLSLHYLHVYEQVNIKHLSEVSQKKAFCSLTVSMLIVPVLISLASATASSENSLQNDFRYWVFFFCILLDFSLIGKKSLELEKYP